MDEASSWGLAAAARDPASDEPPPKRRSSANSAGAGCVSSASPNNGLVAPLVELPVVTTVPRTAFPTTQGGPVGGDVLELGETLVEAWRWRSNRERYVTI